VANGISPIMRCASWPVTKLKKERPDLCSRNDANIVIIIVIISSLRIAFAVDAELTCVGCYFTKLSSLYINSVLCFSRMKNLLLRIEAIFQFLLGQNVKNEVLFSILLSWVTVENLMLDKMWFTTTSQRSVYSCCCVNGRFCPTDMDL